MVATASRMRSFGTVLALVLSAGCVNKPILMPELRKGERQLRYSQNVQLFRMPQNGLTVMLLPDDNTNLVQVSARYQVGAADDPPGKAGLAHLVEHVLFEVQPFGAGKPTLAHYLGAASLGYNAYTNWDTTHYTATAMAENLAPLLVLEARRMQATCEQLDDGLLRREIDVVKNERLLRDGAYERFTYMMHAQIYGKDHPYARPLGGTEAELGQITRADVCAFIEAHYSSKAAFLVVSGKFVKDEALGLINRFFGAVPARVTAPRHPVALPALRGTSSEHRLPVETPMAIVTFAALHPRAGDAMVQRILLHRWQGELGEMASKGKYMEDVFLWRSGGERAPLVSVVVTAKSPDKLRGAVDKVFEARDEMIQGIGDKWHSARWVRDQAWGADFSYTNRMRSLLYSDTLFAAEAFTSRAHLFLDYLEHAGHDDFLVHDLQAIDRIDSEILKGAAPGMFRREDSHVAYIYPQEGSAGEGEETMIAGRAATRQEGPSYDIRDWDIVVDPREADAMLAVRERGLGARVVERELGNGLRVLLVPSLAYPVVDIRLLLPAGSLHEPENKPGLAALAALLLRVIPNDLSYAFMSLDELDELDFVWQMGGRFERYVDERVTVFQMTGLAMYADALLWRLHNLLAQGEYTSRTLDVFRRELAKIESKKNPEQTRRQRAVLKALFGKKHPYVTQEASAASLDGISVADLERFRDRHYRMRGATLIITGQFDADLVNAEIDRLFGSLEDNQEPAPALRPAPAASMQSNAAYLAIPMQESRQIGIVVAFATRPGFVSQNAARQVLREMVQAKLRALRDKLGATYDVTVSHVTGEGPGVLLITTVVDRSRAVASFLAVRRALEELQTGDLTEAFVRARRRVLHDMLAITVTSQGLAGELEFIAANGLQLDHTDDVAKQVAALRPDDIRALIAAEMAPGREVVIMQGPESTVAEVYQAAGISDYRTVP